MADDLSGLFERMRRLEWALNSREVMGTIEERKPGAVRVRIGQRQDGNGGPGEPVVTGWIRTSEHAGFATRNTSYREGQTVLVRSANGAMTQSTVQPLSHSEYNPIDGNAANDADTYRIRKEPQGPRQQGGEPPKAQDDDEDVQIIRKYDSTVMKMGKSGAQYEMTRGKGVLRFGDGGPQVEVTKDHAILKFNESSYIKITAEGIVLKGAKIEENP